MAAHGRKKRHDDHGEHVDERWLLTYSDLITLLMALFMVLFSISSVNKSKFESLQHALQDAFSGRILPGGKSIKEAGGTDNVSTPSSSPPDSSLQPYVGAPPKDAAATAAGQQKEQQDFRKLKAQIDAVAASHGLQGKIQTKITPDGLLIRVLTDDLLFDSGSATPRQQAVPLLDKLAQLLNRGVRDHQLVVEGHTDNQPIHSALFPDNWALSTARAESVVRAFLHAGISAGRMTAAGRSAFKPIASNATAAGRSLNRRVEILVPRQATSSISSTQSDGTPTIPSIRPHLTPTS